MSDKKEKSIILAVDLSEYSFYVVKMAKLISKKLGAKLVFTYVFDDISIRHSSFPYRKALLAEYYDFEVKRKYKLSDKDRVVIEFGKPYKQIIAVAERMKPLMIIASHKGENPAVEFFIGSNAEKLALLSKVPVWIYRGGKLEVPKRVLVPCDLSPRSGATISAMKSALVKLGAKLELLYVTQVPMPILDYEAYSRIAKQMSKAEERSIIKFKKLHPLLKTTRVLGGLSVVDQIQKHLKKFDMVAVSPHSKRSYSPFLGSVTAKLIRYGTKSVLVIP